MNRIFLAEEEITFTTKMSPLKRFYFQYLGVLPSVMNKKFSNVLQNVLTRKYMYII